MKVIIIEDESAAARRLEKLLIKTDCSAEISAVIESVEDAIEWLGSHEEPDLMFLDIQLSDGLCFEIFDEIEIECPVIFTTAYDEYAIRAFKLNSIDYLLKPVNQKDLEKSIEKYHKLTKNDAVFTKNNMDALLNHLSIKQPMYKSRFLVKLGEAFYPVSCEDIMYICIEHQMTNLVTKAGKQFIVDHTLDELDKLLNPEMFYRINRQMIVSAPAVKSVHTYFNSRLKLFLIPDYPKDVIVSREKVSSFKKWLDT